MTEPKVNCPVREVKTCNVCKLVKPWVEFGRRKASPVCGRQAHCSPCSKAKNVLRRRWNGSAKKSQPIQERARGRTKSLERSGQLVRATACMGCGRNPVEAHHPDYSRPDFVLWLCRLCHEMVHWFEKYGEPHPDDDQDNHLLKRLT